MLKQLAGPFNGNKLFDTKYRQYRADKEKYNTLFLGSSRIYRQVNPEIIDQQLESYGVKSYNLGSAGTFMPEGIYMAEAIIGQQSDTSDLKYMFIELMEVTSIEFVNWFPRQSFYYLDWSYVQLAWNAFDSNPDLSWPLKVAYTYPYFQGFLLRNILPGRWPNEFPVISKAEGDRGYYPLELEMEMEQVKEFSARRNAFLSDTTILMKRKLKQDQLQHANLGELYTDRLQGLVQKAEQKGIEVFFVISPKLPYYKAIRRDFPGRLDHRIIDLGSYERYPEFNQAKNSFDKGHLNTRGAEIYSAALAEEIRKALDNTVSTETHPNANKAR